MNPFEDKREYEAQVWPGEWRVITEVVPTADGELLIIKEPGVPGPPTLRWLDSTDIRFKGDAG